MGLFSAAQMAKINEVVAKSQRLETPAKVSKSGKMDELESIYQEVREYFKDSNSILIQSKSELHDYIDEVISAGEAGIDTETTGLDKLNDHIVGSSLYYPGGVECYIPSMHILPIFESPYKNQISYADLAEEFQRFNDYNVKLVFANADFDLAMINNSIGVNLSKSFYYDVILAWRCIKENEPKNGLKELYNKYVLKGVGNPKKFSDFFPPKLFPYCDPKVAQLYAANDAKITYELMQWQLPYITPDNPKCKAKHLEAISKLVWQVEFPLVKTCLDLHTRGAYVDSDTAQRLSDKYHREYLSEMQKLKDMMDKFLSTCPPMSLSKSPFKTGQQFNPNSSIHVGYLCRDLMHLSVGKSVDKKVLAVLNTPITNQIVKVKELDKLLSTYVDKLPNSVGADHRIHATFKSIGADTGRFSSERPNLQNIPSHATDIRHMFRATPAYTDRVSCATHDDGYLVTLPYWGFIKDDHSVDIEVKDLTKGQCILLYDANSENYTFGQIYDIIDLSSTREIYFLLNEHISSNLNITINVRYNSNVMLSSDYSSQEPRLTAFVSNDPIMIKTFQEGKDIYGSIASVAFNLPYENCLEFHPETHEYQPDGKARRSEAKTIVLGKPNRLVVLA